MNGLNSVVDTAGYTNMPVTVPADNVYVKVVDGRIYILPNTIEGMTQFKSICNEQWHGAMPEQPKEETDASGKEETEGS